MSLLSLRSLLLAFTLGFDTGSERFDIGGIFFSIRVAQFPFVVDTALHQVHGLSKLALFFIGQTQIPACVSFSMPVADLACDREVLFMEFDGALELAKIRVGETEPAERISFC